MEYVLFLLIVRFPHDALSSWRLAASARDNSSPQNLQIVELAAKASAC